MESTIRLGIQLYDKNKNILNALYATSHLNKIMHHYDIDTIKAEINCDLPPGKYWLKFDMFLVHERCWFEGVGSPVFWLKMTVIRRFHRILRTIFNTS